MRLIADAPVSVEIKTPRWALPLLAPARLKGAFGGRGSGKSRFFAELAIEEAICIDQYRMVCIREVQKSLKHSVKQLLEDCIYRMNVASYFRVRDTHIDTMKGGIILFQGAQHHTIESIKSLEGFDRAWIEEGQTMSQKSLDLIIPTIRKPKSQIWASWNPDKPSDPIDALLRGENPPPDAIVCGANYLDNPWFPPDLLSHIEYDRRRDIDKFNHIWLGRYSKRSEARVFRNWRIGEWAEIEDIPPDTSTLQGADWGYASDPSVFIRVRVHKATRRMWITHEAYGLNVEIDHTPTLFKQVPDAEKWETIADSARPETISWMRRNGGFPKMRAAKKGPNSVIEGVEFLKTFDIIVSPACARAADELSYYSYEIDKDTDQITPKIEDKNNHVIDAIRYAIEPLRASRIGVH